MSSDARSSLDQLSGKKRTYEDLSRFVGARASGIANYSLLLGAGCSVSSNIRSASQLVEQWRKEVYSRFCPGKDYEEEKAIEYLSKNEAVWYNPQREYSSLFEKNFDLPRQRRMFVETEVAEKKPNLGYAYLIRLIEEGFLNTIFTTNFDDLVNESFFQFSQKRPIVCAHDSSVGSISVTSKRPKVIKLHGDYLFDDIKATVRETESLEDNTRKKFIEFFRDFGLIVIGYGGGDRSIMDVLQYLLRSEDYFKHGIYWCIRKGERPSDELLKLLWRDRVYFVEIDGFDELMASLHSDLVGASLPIDTGVVTSKPGSIIKGFCENSFLSDSPSEVIKRDLGKLRKQSEREELFSVIREARGDVFGKEAASDESLSERELVVIFEIKQSLSIGEFDAARDKINADLNRKPSRGMREELSELKVRVEELAGDLSAALSAVDSLINEDPQEPENYIRKTYLAVELEDRVKALDRAISIDPDNYRVYSRLFDCYVDAYQAGVFVDRQDLLSKIEQSFEKSIRCEPGLRNPVWRGASEFYSSPSCCIPKEDVKKKLDDIVKRSSVFGERRTVALRARLARWSRYEEDRSSGEATSLLNDISDSRLKSSKSLQEHYEWLELDAYRKLDRKEELSRRLSELSINPDLSETRDYLRRKSDFLVKFNGDIRGGIDALLQGIDINRTRNDILRAATLMELIGDHDGVSNLISKYGGNLLQVDRISLKRIECSAKNDHEGALAQLRLLRKTQPYCAQHTMAETHDLLLLTRYKEASALSKELLDKVNWNKNEFAELIVNYEISQVRLGEQVNKKRLGDLLSVTLSEQVKGCCFYLLGDYQKSKEAFSSIIRNDKEERYVIQSWAIFKEEKGKAFISDLLKLVS
jgi:tetratricopeptide (TPR) repeat protein